MIPNELSILSSPEFDATIVASTPNVLRLLLARTAEVRELRKAFDAGSITGQQIRAFVEGLLRASAALDVFPHQTALAAIAVAFENRFGPFAREYVSDLARLQGPRFWFAGRVGKLCLAGQSQFAESMRRSFEFSVPSDAETVIISLLAPGGHFQGVSVSAHCFEIADASS